jgi:hypothetical protein
MPTATIREVDLEMVVEVGEGRVEGGALLVGEQALRRLAPLVRRTPRSAA